MALLPTNVVHFEIDVLVNGYPASFGWWMFMEDALLGDVTFWHATLVNCIFTMGGPLGDCMHDGASLLTCRCAVGGPVNQRYAAQFSVNHGAWSGGQVEAIAVGLYVASSSGGRGSGSRIHIPAVPDVFVDDNVRLSVAGRDNLTVLAGALFHLQTVLLAPSGAPSLLGTLRTKTAAGPLAVPVFDQARQVVPTLRVERIGRRLFASRGLSSA